MNSVEIIALIVILAALLKILILLIKPKAWMDFTKNFLGKPVLSRVVSLILAAVVLYYLIQEGITIIQIFAVTAFVAALIMFGLAPHFNLLIKKYGAQIQKGKLWKENWLYTLI
jgi:hypothetical protein